MKYATQRDKEIVRHFREGASRKRIAKAYFVSMSTVDRAIQKYVKPGGTK